MRSRTGGVGRWGSRSRVEARGLTRSGVRVRVFEREDSSAGRRRGGGGGALLGGGAGRPWRAVAVGCWATGARPPLRLAPLPPRGSCPDHGRRRLIVFHEGSASVSAARPGTWEGRIPGREGRARAQDWTCSRTRSPAAERAAPRPRSHSPGLPGRGDPLRVHA